MLKLSAVIITLNEEENILRALRSLEGLVAEVVVVDSGSTDQTLEICRVNGARLFSRPWEGYSSAKNFGNSMATHQWILSLDADEELSPELRTSLIRFTESDPGMDTVVSFNRLTRFCGTWIRHSGWYPDRKRRIWHRDFGRWEGDIHEELCFVGAPREIHVSGDLLHYSFPDMEHYLRQRDRFATLAAEAMHRRGQKASVAKVWLAPVVRFLRDYLLRRGVLHGTTGWRVCRLNAEGVWMKYSRLRQLNVTDRR
jgi:glycosyltransferase involved in cell wall biosynthesis